MSVVDTTDYKEVELGSADDAGADLARSPSKIKRQDVKWPRVSFRVKDKNILQDCWGHVVSRCSA